MQDESAGIVHAPLHVRNGEAGLDRGLAVFHLHLNGERDFVGCAVDAKHAVHLNLRRSLPRHRALDAIGRERDLRILGAFENLLLHTAVARIVAARAARGIHHHLASNFAGGGIAADGAALQLEIAMHGVQSGRQFECNNGVRGVGSQHDLLAPGRRRNGQRGQEKLGTHRWKDSSVWKIRGSAAMARNAGLRSQPLRSMPSISFDISVGRRARRLTEPLRSGQGC